MMIGTGPVVVGAAVDVLLGCPDVSTVRADGPAV
jgi:hypothetical protein